MKIKNIIIYLVVGIIVISSFKIPEVILKMEETALENNIYQKKSKKAINDINLDIDAEKVYLVKALHDLQIINEVTISSSTIVETKLIKEKTTDETHNLDTLEDEKFKNAIKQLKKIIECNVLKDITIDKIISFKLINSHYRNDKEQYIIYNVLLEIDNKKYDLEIEDKTGKIIKISLQNNDFSDDLEQLMINFVKYLDLYIIDDWTFEENMLKSKKAELVVKLNESDDDISLSINSSQKLYEYVMK